MPRKTFHFELDFEEVQMELETLESLLILALEAVRRIQAEMAQPPGVFTGDFDGSPKQN